MLRPFPSITQNKKQRFKKDFMKRDHNHEHDNHQHRGTAIVREMNHSQQMHPHEANEALQHDHVHNKRAGHHTENFLKRFWICLIVTRPILLLSEMIHAWFGFTIHFAGRAYLLLGLGEAAQSANLIPKPCR